MEVEMAAVSADASPHSEVDEQAFQTLREEIRAYVADSGERWAEEIEHGTRPMSELWAELRDAGYLRLAAPVEYGGRGLPLARYLELLEIFAASHASLRMIMHVANGIWRPIAANANEDQRGRFLLPLVAGEIKVAFALTEPNAGTGADLRCEVVREGDSYYVTGEKHLITYGSIADYLVLIARLAGTTGSAGTVAVLIPPRGEGVQANVMPQSMGLHRTDHAHLVFDSAPVPVANRLAEEGDGLTVALRGFLAPSRISLAMTCVGLAQRALDLAVAYAKRRETFGRRLAERQAISFRLAEMATDVEAARALVMTAARLWDAGGDPIREAAMAKLFAADALQRVTDAALQIHGGIGYFSPSPIERVYRDARAQLFEEGTAEVQKMTIARELLR
jgi:alkylation response protein AidB-like acyl-CoA dehydrogenase